MFEKRLGTEEEPFPPLEAKIHRAGQEIGASAASLKRELLCKRGGIVLTVCDEALFACPPLCASHTHTHRAPSWDVKPPAVPPPLLSARDPSLPISSRQRGGPLREDSSAIAAVSNGSSPHRSC